MSRLRSAWLRNALFALVCVVAGGVIGLKAVYAQSAEFQALKEDLAFLQSQVTAALLFTPFGTDTSAFEKHALSDGQVEELCAASGGSDCGNLGVNFGTIFRDGRAQYNKANQFNMKWVLEIARATDPGAAATTIGENKDKTVIIRTGVAGNSIGFAGHTGNAADYISYLRQVSDMTEGAEFIAIAGPNEPDIEEWIAPECGKAPGTATPESDEFYQCIGAPLANYMNAVCNAGLPDNITLVTPAFNMTSYTFPGIVKAMNDAGADWGCIAASGNGKGGFAGNLYPAGKSMQAYWTDENTGAAITALKSYGLSNIYITETGPVRALDDGAGASEDSPDDEDFYIHPILGVDSGNVKEIRTDLIKQGYEVQCATPNFYITLEPSGQDAMEILLDPANKPDGVVLGGESFGHEQGVGKYIRSTLNTDFRESLVPVFRDLDAPAQLKRSIEDYFSYKEINGGSFNGTEIKSAPINSLLTRKQRCIQAVESLEARKVMCDKLADPNACTLYQQEIPGSAYNTKTLLEYYNSYASGEFSGQSTDEICATVTSDSSRDYIDLRESLLATPLEISESYRIAFLVTTIRLKYASTQSLFNLFSHPKGGDLNGPNKPKTAVVVTAFKIPDITTNKGTIEGQSASGNTPYNDPSVLTRDSLLPSFIRDLINTEGNDERQTLLDTANTVASQPQTENDGSNGFEIFCLVNTGGEVDSVEGLGSCKDPVTKALVDIINAQHRVDPDSTACEEDIFLEENKRLFNSGGLETYDHPSHVFQPALGGALLTNIFTDVLVHTPGNDYAPDYGETEGDYDGDGLDFGLKSVFQVVPEMRPFPYDSERDDREVKHFLVYPVGYDQETVETVLAGSFFSTKQLEALKEEAEQKLLLQMKNAQAEFEGGSDNYSFTDNRPDQCVTKIDATGLPYEDCPTRGFGFSVSLRSIPEDIGLLGARLGYWMYTTQKAFFTAASLPRKYLDACRTVEEFLLDQCGGSIPPIVEDTPDIQYCDGSDYNTVTVTNSNTDNFTFYQGTENDEIDPSEFLASGTGQSCQFYADMKVVDGLTIILSGGEDIVGNNPGNGPCSGILSASEVLELRRLPAQGSLPSFDDDRWNDAPVMKATGPQASRIKYDLKLNPGYYRVRIDRKDKLGICLSNHTEVYNAASGEQIGENYYVFDLSGSACSQKSCMNVTLQPAMEGADEDDTDGDVGNCDLSFKYESGKFNNRCGGGRTGSCESEDGCDWWWRFYRIFKSEEDPNEDDPEDWQTNYQKYRDGYAKYKQVFGRKVDVEKDQIRCTHIADDKTPLFVNTMRINDCSNSGSGNEDTDPAPLFDPFTITYWDGSDVEFAPPTQELWGYILSSSSRHGCDPYLVLATAHAMSRDYTNQNIPDGQGRLGLFQITPEMWDKWKTPNQENGNASGQYGMCDFWQPASFRDAGMDFSSPTNMREAVDTACRRILWSGAQKYSGDQSEFTRSLSTRSDAPDGSVNREGKPIELYLPSDTYRPDYIYRAWEKLREVTGITAKSQPSGYPYTLLECTGKPPEPPAGADSLNYDVPTDLPYTGWATFYSEGVMNRTLNLRETYFREIPPALIDTCEINIGGSNWDSIFDELFIRARSNGTGKVVGCGAMLRMGDVPFRSEPGSNKVRMVWLKRPEGAPASVPKAVGPIAIIDVAATKDYDYIYNNFGGEWVIDLDFNTFRRMYGWMGGIRWRDKQRMTVCDTKEQCEAL